MWAIDTRRISVAQSCTDAIYDSMQTASCIAVTLNLALNYKLPASIYIQKFLLYVTNWKSKFTLCNRNDFDLNVPNLISNLGRRAVWEKLQLSLHNDLIWYSKQLKVIFLQRNFKSFSLYMDQVQPIGSAIADLFGVHIIWKFYFIQSKRLIVFKNWKITWA